MTNNTEKKPERRQNHTPGRIVNLICVAVVLVLFAGITLFNLFQPNRATISESENRTLATIPEFSFGALFDGSYYDGLTDFFSDTFLGREKLITISKSFKSVFGFDYSLNGEKYRYVDVGGNTQKTDETTGDENEFVDVTLPDITTRPVTTAEITTSEVTTAPVETGAEGSSSVTEPVETTETPFRITSVTLSNEKLNITNGTSRLLTATVSYVGSGSVGPIKFEADTEGIVTIETEGNVATITAVKNGTVNVTVTVGNVQSVCAITVTSANVVVEDDIIGFSKKNLFVYGNAIYNPVDYSDSKVKDAASAYSKCLVYLGQVFDGARVSVLPAPHNSSVLDTSVVKKAGKNQGTIINLMKANYDSSINLVNSFDNIWAHRDEYLYFKTGYHWTSRGAYYAYAAYMESIGETPTPISSLEMKVLNENWEAEQYSYMVEAGLGSIRDRVEAYMPNVSAKMVVTSATPIKEGKTVVGYKTAQTTTKSSIITIRTGYSAFISGDNPLTIIDSPEITNGKTILVLKDSYGCAMVPYLTMNYSKIIVVDPRYYYRSFNEKLQDQLSDYKIDDILVVMNIENFQGTSFRNNIYKLVGIDVQ